MVAITESGDSFVPDGALVVAASLLTAVVVLRQFLGQRELLKVHLELGRAHEELGALATTDPLTGIANHRALQVALHHELDRAQRHDRRLAVLFLDLDHFKALNDTVGHVAGDEALQEVAAVMASCLRPSDLMGRWGGEEFLVLLPEADTEAAAAIAERVRRSVAERAFQVGHGYHLTCSIGAAVYPDDAQGRDALISTADRAMYVAKHLGRNQVVTAASVDGDTLAPDAVLSSRDEHAMIGAVEALAAMVDARDHGTASHAADVSRMSTQLAFGLGCTSNESHFIGLAAQLHDIGKVIVPDAVLKKSGPLTDVEWDVIRQHPIVGAEVASGAPALRSIAPIIRSHHERWDGTGYPDELAGEQIPFASRVIAVADAYSAMTSDRPYREAMSDAAARTELERCAGTQFDSAVVGALDELREPEPEPEPVAA
jgi:diguanylate cyclase (GGDEF)-like protein